MLCVVAPRCMCMVCIYEGAHACCVCARMPQGLGTLVHMLGSCRKCMTGVPGQLHSTCTSWQGLHRLPCFSTTFEPFPFFSLLPMPAISYRLEGRRWRL